MANKIISAFFTKSGLPETGLSPTIDIWELDPTNPAVNTLIVNNGALTEVGGGSYRYDFGTYDFTKNYNFIVDGTSTLPPGERYQFGGNDAFNDEISATVWSENLIAYGVANTAGFIINKINTDLSSVKIDVTTMLSIVTTLLKYQENRTRIDKTAKTLTVYDNDGTTPLKVFDLKDSTGAASTTEVCERLPV